MLETILQSPYGIWLPLGLLICGFIGSTLLVVNLIYFVMKKKLQPIAKKLGGHIVSNLLDGPSIRLKHNDNTYKISSKLGGKNTLPSLLIKRSSSLKFRFRLIVKKFSHVPTYLYLQRGRSIKTGDFALEEQISIKSNSIELANIFFQNSNNMNIIKFLLDKGYQRISSEKNNLLIQKWDYDDNDLSIEKMHKILDKLNEFDF